MALMMKSVVFCPNIEKAKETYDIKFINPIKKISTTLYTCLLSTYYYISVSHNGFTTSFISFSFSRITRNILIVMLG